MKKLMIRAGAVLLLAVDQTSGFVGTSRRHRATSSRYGLFWRNARVSSGSSACGFGGYGVGKATAVAIADEAFRRLHQACRLTAVLIHVRCAAALIDCSFNAPVARTGDWSSIDSSSVRVPCLRCICVYSSCRSLFGGL